MIYTARQQDTNNTSQGDDGAVNPENEQVMVMEDDRPQSGRGTVDSNQNEEE